MAETTQFELVTPERLVLSEPAEMVVVIRSCSAPMSVASVGW